MRNLTKTLLSGSLIATAALAAMAAPAPALADDPIVRSAAEDRAAFEADRETILAMAGDYKVTFDMRESTAWHEDYEPIEPKISGGHESVRVVEDTGDRIVLQHLLVVGSPDDPMVIKHWRQDWQYEPEKILTYEGGDSWAWTEVPEPMRAGRWSQTVYQVDDSPRYAGWGQWEEVLGIKRWRSNWTARPLARRDAVRDPVYDRYVGINRHQMTPDGWIHWQDNTKMMPALDADGTPTGELVPVVQEYVLNTYERFDDYNVEAADEYWSQTARYWDAVRDKWDEIAGEAGTFRVDQEPNYGTEIADDLLMLADAIAKGEKEEDAATAEALALIEEGTARGGG